VPKEKPQDEIKVNRDYDVPELAGYSIDGQTIYVHREIQTYLALPSGKKMNIIMPVVVHEVVEKSIMDKLGFSYIPAHYMAFAAEHRYLKERGHTPAELKLYDDYFLHLEKELRTPARLTKLPPDLDTIPDRKAGHRCEHE
jgi:hypothetical protein